METPLWQALLRHVGENRTSLHTPGHKSGQIMPPALAAAWGDEVFRYDLTEVGDLDVLYRGDGVLAQSQAAVAEECGAAFARYLLGGSTLGILAGIMACGRGQTVLVPRHAHQSVYHAVALAGATPVYLQPDRDAATGLALGVSTATLRRALAAHPEAALLVVVDPTYHGARYDNAALVALARDAGLTVLTDAAHGAHFGWAAALPARPQGDVVVLSAHKTLPALTGASVLLGYDPALADAIDVALRLFASSSPSYLGMASLEAAFAYAASDAGRAALTAACASVQAARASLAALPGLHLWTPPGEGDPLRLWLWLDGCSGADFAAALAARGRDVELAGQNGVLLLFAPGGVPDGLVADIAAAAADCRRTASVRPSCSAAATFDLPLPETVLPLRKALWARSEKIPFADACGRIAGDFLLDYPPGIPYLVPGERLDAAVHRACLGAGIDPARLFSVLVKEGDQ